MPGPAWTRHGRCVRGALRQCSRALHGMHTPPGCAAACLAHNAFHSRSTTLPCDESNTRRALQGGCICSLPLRSHHPASPVPCKRTQHPQPAHTPPHLSLAHPPHPSLNPPPPAPPPWPALQSPPQSGPPLPAAPGRRAARAAARTAPPASQRLPAARLSGPPAQQSAQTRPARLHNWEQQCWCLRQKERAARC